MIGGPDKKHLKESIAIIGMGCRFPGAPDVQSFWRLLEAGADAIVPYPGGRFADLDAVYAPDAPSTPGQYGGYLDRLDLFDAEFFGISPREAVYMDPQQRLLLETAWEAIEDAGQVREHLAGSRTGVFIGLWTGDYEDRMIRSSSGLSLYVMTGGGRFAASGRLSYAFDLRGPSFTVDTACSSSLVAVHLACKSLWAGECDMALAGGANAILGTEIAAMYSSVNMLSPDGRCKFTDASADGLVRSEGAGVIVLKPLSQALADRDPIYALIRGGAINNDGQSSGSLVSPAVAGQEAMLREALRDAQTSPDQIQYVEAHGTGTSVGDRVEIQALARIFGEGKRRAPCVIGSVKTNIGHTEAAAGIAGLMKVALALKHQTIPANRYGSTPTSAVAWDRIPLAVQMETAPWPGGARPALAGVSGFGITGTNAHVIVEEVASASSRIRAGSSLCTWHTSRLDERSTSPSEHRVPRALVVRRIEVEADVIAGLRVVVERARVRIGLGTEIRRRAASRGGRTRGRPGSDRA